DRAADQVQRREHPQYPHDQDDPEHLELDTPAGLGGGAALDGHAALFVADLIPGHRRALGIADHRAVAFGAGSTDARIASGWFLHKENLPLQVAPRVNSCLVYSHTAPGDRPPDQWIRVILRPRRP